MRNIQEAIDALKEVRTELYYVLQADLPEKALKNVVESPDPQAIWTNLPKSVKGPFQPLVQLATEVENIIQLAGVVAKKDDKTALSKLADALSAVDTLLERHAVLTDDLQAHPDMTIKLQAKLEEKNAAWDKAIEAIDAKITRSQARGSNTASLELDKIALEKRQGVDNEYQLALANGAPLYPFDQEVLREAVEHLQQVVR